MIYQVRANLYFKQEAHARSFEKYCRAIFPQATSINPASVNSELSIVELIENHHDESPTAPCLLLAGISTKPDTAIKL